MIADFLKRIRIPEKNFKTVLYVILPIYRLVIPSMVQIKALVNFPSFFRQPDHKQLLRL